MLVHKPTSQSYEEGVNWQVTVTPSSTRPDAFLYYALIKRLCRSVNVRPYWLSEFQQPVTSESVCC